MNTAEKLRMAIMSCIVGHSAQPKSKTMTTRKWDGNTPYSVHPIWCAVTFLQETQFTGEVKEKRWLCALALLFHDFLEDTTASLPRWLPLETVKFIGQMSYESSAAEMVQVWDCPAIIRLLKLYDKVSNLLDGAWMPDEKWNDQYVPYVLRLASDVEKNYGDLNIVPIARAIAIPRSQIRE